MCQMMIFGAVRRTEKTRYIHTKEEEEEEGEENSNYVKYSL